MNLGLAPCEQPLPFAYYKARKCHHGIADHSYMAWGALIQMKTDSAVFEPQNPIHFCFGATEDEAVEKLTAEMDTAYGKRRWWKQEVTQ